MKLTFLIGFFITICSSVSFAQTINNDILQEADSAQSLDDIRNTVAVGQPYKKKDFGAWTLRCVRTEEGVDPCQLFQLLLGPDGSPVAEFTMINLQPSENIVAGANVVTPLETLLTSQLIIKVGDKMNQTYPFSFCVEIGCVARVGFSSTDLENYKKGNSAMITIVPANAPDSPQNLTLSLKGFTDGFTALRTQ